MTASGAAVASRVIAPTKRRRDGRESPRTLEKCHRRAFRVRLARQVARERSRSRIEQRNIQLVQLVSLRVLHNVEWLSLRDYIQGLFTVSDPPFFVLLDALGEGILHGALATLVSTPDSSILDEYIERSG